MTGPQPAVRWPLGLVDDLAEALTAPAGTDRAAAIQRFTCGLLDHDPGFGQRLAQAINCQHMIHCQRARL